MQTRYQSELVLYRYVMNTSKQEHLCSGSIVIRYSVNAASFISFIHFHIFTEGSPSATLIFKGPSTYWHCILLYIGISFYKVHSHDPSIIISLRVMFQNSMYSGVYPSRWKKPLLFPSTWNHERYHQKS